MYGYGQRPSMGKDQERKKKIEQKSFKKNQQGQERQKKIEQKSFKKNQMRQT
jgi:hypothetical protein